MAQNTATDDSTEPEYTDDQIRDVIAELDNLVENEYDLRTNVSSVISDQLHGFAVDDSPLITMFLTTERGTTEARIIQAVLDSDIPVVLSHTAPNHEQLTFRLTA